MSVVDRKNYFQSFNLNPHFKAFTLVELLVVISIIALLLAVLMPALQKAREQGRRVVCGTNEKQIAAASMMYAMENNGYMVQDRGIRLDKYNNVKIIGTIAQAQRPWDSAFESQWTSNNKNNLKKYVTCPSDRYLRVAPPLSLSPWYVGGAVLKRSFAPNSTLFNGIWRGGMPNVLLGNKTCIPTKITEVRHASRLMIFGECHKGANWISPDVGGPYGNVQGTNVWEALGTLGNCETYWAKNSPVRDKKEFNTVHDAGANFAFADGHVQWCGAVKGEDYNTGQPFKGIQYPLDWQWDK